jgi:DNA-binding NtrC family response regulator
MPELPPARRPDPPPNPTLVGFHGAVLEFKRRLIEATLHQLGGNRTRTARALGLQRTYLLRLMREFGVNVPGPSRPGPGRPADGGHAANGSQGR